MPGFNEVGLYRRPKSYVNRLPIRTANPNDMLKMAAELVAVWRRRHHLVRRPRLARAAQGATRTIPVVFVDDRDRSRWASSLASRAGRQHDWRKLRSPVSLTASAWTFCIELVHRASTAWQYCVDPARLRPVQAKTLVQVRWRARRRTCIHQGPQHPRNRRRLRDVRERCGRDGLIVRPRRFFVSHRRSIR